MAVDIMRLSSNPQIVIFLGIKSSALRRAPAGPDLCGRRQPLQNNEDDSGEVPFNQDELLGSTSRPTVTINEQRRANLDRAHFWQGVLRRLRNT